MNYNVETLFTPNMELSGEYHTDCNDMLEEIASLRAQVATLTETIASASAALASAPAWHQGIRDAIDTLKNYEVKK